MSADKAPAPPPRVDDAERARFLELMFWETAEKMRAAIAAENPSASTLQAARMWFRDQGINLKTLRSLRPGSPLGKLAGSLPTFPDDQDDGDVSQQHPALRSVSPFVPDRPPPTSTNHDDTD